MSKDEQISELQHEVSKLKQGMLELQRFTEALRSLGDTHDEKLMVIEEILELDE